MTEEWLSIVVHSGDSVSEIEVSNSIPSIEHVKLTWYHFNLANNNKLPAPCCCYALHKDSALGHASATRHSSMAVASTQAKEREQRRYTADYSGSQTMIDHTASLRSYHINNNTHLNLLPIVRVFSIHLEDGTVKRILLDYTKTVKEIIKDLADKLTLESGMDYGLGVLDQSNTNHTWLLPSSYLGENTLECDELYFVRRFFFRDRAVSENSMDRHMLYIQCRDKVLSEQYPCFLEEACQLAAVQLWVEFGDVTDIKGLIEAEQCLPAKYARDKTAQRKVVDRHRSLWDMSRSAAKLNYITQCKNLPSYGCTLYYIKEVNASKRVLCPVLLGISCDTLARFNTDSKALLSAIHLTRVKSWEFSGDFMKIIIDDEHCPVHEFQSSKVPEIVEHLGSIVERSIVRVEEEMIPLSPSLPPPQPPHRPRASTLEKLRSQMSMNSSWLQHRQLNWFKRRSRGNEGKGLLT